MRFCLCLPRKSKKSGDNSPESVVIRMKKFASLLCVIACVFGLTACGSGKELTEFEQSKVDAAVTMATEYLIPSFDSFRTPEQAAMLNEYTAEEVAHIMLQSTGLTVDGYGYQKAVSSFNGTYDAIGERVGIGVAEAEIDDDRIVVSVEILGTNSTAEAEIILSNDMFLAMESAALNPTAAMSDLMMNAALNTLIGMGTVFVVLILISAIISSLGILPKIQAKMAGKKKEKEPLTQEVLEDDSEVAAVIAAAIAASQGAGTDGVVCSFRGRTSR